MLMRAITVRIDALRELADLAGGDDLRLKALLRRLVPEDGEIGPGNDREDDLDILLP